MNDEADFRFESDARYAVLTLRAPVAESLRDGLARLAALTDVRTLLLVLSAETLAAPGPAAQALPDALDRDCHPLVLQLRALPYPVICAVGGYATGLAAGIALACDVVVATHRAAFNFSFREGTTLPGCGSTWLLPRMVGMTRALGMLLLRDKLTADEAERYGLIWACVADDRLLDEGHGIARYFASQPSRALAAVKRALQAAADNDFDAQLHLEAAMHRELANDRQPATADRPRDGAGGRP